MNELLRTASQDVSSFLALQLPALSPNWWDKLVLDKECSHEARP